MAGLRFLVSVVLTPQGEIAAVGGGEFQQLHRRMGQAFLDLYTVELAAKPDVVVTTVDWWQGAQDRMDSLYGFVTHSMTTMKCFADDGATIVLVGNAPGGMWAGVREYTRTVYTLEDLADLIYKGGTLAFVAPLMGIQCKECQAKYRTIMAVDGVSAETLEDMGFETAPSPNQALEMALGKHGPNARVAVLPALGCPNWPVVRSRP
jgi:nickel-dependent lactate racemase